MAHAEAGQWKLKVGPRTIECVGRVPEESTADLTFDLMRHIGLMIWPRLTERGKL
jgi:hypothetical protein